MGQRAAVEQQARRAGAAVAVLGLLAGTAALLGLAPGAQAAGAQTAGGQAVPAAAATKSPTKTPTVTIHVGGSAPGTVPVPRGDTVTFVNDGLFAHTLTATTKNWTFTADIPGGGTYTYAKPLTVNGTYSFAGTGGLDGMNGTLAGNARVGPAPVPSATPKPSTSASPAPSTPASPGSGAPRPTASPAPPAAGVASPSAPAGTVSGSGQAVPYLDPLTGQIVPFSGAQPSTGVQQPSVAGEPAPSAVATPQASPSASSSPGGAAYASSNRGVTASSPHKYGLPTLVAFVAIVGVASLIVRVLLAEPLPPRT